jgi:type IV pilus assembly protein PilC
MAIFKYTAEDSKGRTKHGTVVGLSDGEVTAKLRKKDLNPLTVINITDTFESKFLMFIAPIKTKDLVIFSRQFSVMVSASVPIVESLLILVDQTNNLTFKNMLSEIAFEVDGGAFLSDAFAKRPKTFSDFFVNIVRSGESSGKLDDVLNYLADEMEKNYDMTSKIKGAMIYPIFISVALICVAVVLMIYIIPSLTSTFADSGMELPWATRVIMAFSSFLQKYIIMIIIFVIGLVIAIRFYAKTYNGKRNLDIIKLRLPVFGVLFKYIYLMRFTRSLSTLLKGGVTITRSLEIVADVVGSTIYRELILETLESINDGNPLSMVMENSNYVPKMVPQMISVGEKTGKIDSVLDRVTNFYSRESANMLDNLSKLMEPMIMVVMGVGVGIMVAAVLLPMYNMANMI